MTGKAQYPPLEQGVNKGLPKLDLSKNPYSWFEFLPAWLVYIPVVIYWILLSLRYRNFGLPMLANPRIELGGMIGESKSEILEQAGAYAQQYVLPWVLVTKNESDPDSLLEAVMESMRQSGIEFPLIAKPDLGCRGNNVQKCDDLQALRQYLERFPVGRSVILQKLAPWGAEAGIFYIRWPGSARGLVTSLTLKYRPTVIGDGQRTVAQLIEQTPRAKRLSDLYFANNRELLNTVPQEGSEVALGFLGSHCKGSIFRDGCCWITEALSDAIDAVMQDFPDFHYGRLDVKFESINSLTQGKSFCIIEVNGVSSEQTHIWDSRARFRDALRVLFGQYKLLFAMGDALRKGGLKPPSARLMIKTWLRELRQAQ